MDGAHDFFLNTGSRLEKAENGLDDFKGWWNTAAFFDMDQDGDMDLIAGNWGLNSQVKANLNEPASMVWNDFDHNGSVDPFLNYYIQGVSYPYVSRDELLDQVYPMRRKFTSYKSYADATMKDIFSSPEIDSARHLEATHLSTTLFENVDGRFIPRTLPLQAQFSPVYKIVVHDWNGDNHEDLLLLGNNNHPRLRMGKMDASFGTVPLNDGKGKFRYAGYQETGLIVAGDVKDAAIIGTGTQQHLLIGINNEGWMHYKLNK